MAGVMNKNQLIINDLSIYQECLSLDVDDLFASCYNSDSHLKETSGTQRRVVWMTVREMLFIDRNDILFQSL